MTFKLEPSEHQRTAIRSVVEMFLYPSFGTPYGESESSLDVKPGGTILIRRGGSWSHEAKNCRVSRRYASDHSKKMNGLGLRVVIRDNVV